MSNPLLWDAIQDISSCLPRGYRTTHTQILPTLPTYSLALCPHPLPTYSSSHTGPVFVYMLNHIQLFATPLMVAHQDPLSWDSPGKNTGVGCHALLQGIFPTQGLKLHLLHGQVHSLPLSHLGSPWPCALILNCAWPSAWTILALYLHGLSLLSSDLFSNVTSSEKWPLDTLTKPEHSSPPSQSFIKILMALNTNWHYIYF